MESIIDIDIDNAKRYIFFHVLNKDKYGYDVPFSEYSKTYYWTNENIPGYLDLVSFEGKDSALSVASSGDHAFNLIEKGILNIDTFDTNRLTDYFAFGLKRAMILKYNYNEFILMTHFLRSSFISLEKLTEILLSLLPYMDSNYRKFWKEIIEYNYKLQKEYNTKMNLLQILTFGCNFHSEGINNYLEDKESYEDLKHKLGIANITFRCADAFELDHYFEKDSYDFILLSNILFYTVTEWGMIYPYSTLKEYVDKIEKLSKEDGVIFIQYLMQYKENKNGRSSDSVGLMGNLDGLESESVCSFPSIYGLGKKQAMILKRVKK